MKRFSKSSHQKPRFSAVLFAAMTDILDSIPTRYRMTAAAWLAGEDLRTIMSNGTLYRHAKILREYGLDITEPCNVTKFPTKVHVVELKPVFSS
ncbi:hypothetical protein AAW31_04665 [Nitrosomonas communis]|uniref:Replication-associated protein G2P C-terminal domain-containing protein n=2 Tax=Nitrosomonadaceae TaxID=206379 RepID=A0A0F7KCC9_9PROT|nr:hypothetical protein AAW31_04665 [Nitrosomonas communis]